MKKIIVQKLPLSFSELSALLEASPFKIFGVGGFSSTRAELLPLMKQFEMLYSLSSGEESSVKAFALAHIQVSSSPSFLKKPGEILSWSSTKEFIRSRSEKKIPAIYTFQPSEEIERACLENNWRFIGNPFVLFQKYDDKEAFRSLLRQLDISFASTTTTFSKLSNQISHFFDKFGDKLVVQIPTHGGGRGTFFISRASSKNSLSEIQFRLDSLGIDRESTLLVSPFIDGPCLSVMGCVTRENGILVGPSQYQLIDIPEVTINKSDATGVFCGHDWSLSQNIPLYIHEKAAVIVKRIGEHLQKDGYLGIFGIDYIWNTGNDTLYPLEINPRLLGSFPTVVSVESLNGEHPLVFAHILDFLSIEYTVSNDFSSQKIDRFTNRQGSHLILFNPYKGDVLFKRNLRGGVYTLNEGSLSFVRNGTLLTDITDPEKEFILTDGVPQKGTLVKENRKLLRILSIKPLGASSGKALSPWAKKIVSGVYSAVDLLI